MYIAYLCFDHTYEGDDEDFTGATVVFDEPSRYRWQKVLPISFSVLQEWSEKDKGLYQ